MKIVFDFPPNYAAICEVFDLRGHHNVVFAYGDTIYSPTEQVISDDLIIHEQVHEIQQQQYGGPEKWWVEYLADRKFRLEQEIEAYRAQIAFIIDKRGLKEGRRAARFYARDLSGKMYNIQIDPMLAYRKIMGKIE